MNNQPDQPTDGPVRPVCSRCKRPLTDPAAVAAGIGARCALLDALEAAQPVSEQLHGPDVPAAVIALVAARLGGLPDAVAGDILQDAPAADLAVLLADLTSWMLTHTTGGPAWLSRLGVAWAAEVDA